MSKDKVPVVFHGGRKGEIVTKDATSFFFNIKKLKELLPQ